MVSSDWRRWNPTDAMRALLKLHGLDIYLDECLPPDGSKCDVIPTYLHEHESDIGGWAVVDD